MSKKVVNTVLVEYVKAYKDHYPLEALRQKMLSKGYPATEVEEAISIATSQEPLYNPLPKNSQQQVAQPKNEEAKMIKPKPFIPQGLQRSGKKITSTSGFKLMKTAGILGFLLLVVMLVTVSLNFFGNSLSSTISLSLGGLGILFSLFFLFGLSRLGKHTEEKLLKRSAMIRMILLILFVAATIIFLVSVNNATAQDLLEGFSLTWIIIFGGIFLIHLITKYTYALGLRAAGDVISTAKKAGTLNMILAIIYTLYLLATLYLSFNFTLLTSLSSSASIELAATIILGITGILTIITLVLESLSLLKASKKFE